MPGNSGADGNLGELAKPSEATTGGSSSESEFKERSGCGKTQGLSSPSSRYPQLERSLMIQFVVFNSRKKSRINNDDDGRLGTYV